MRSSIIEAVHGEWAWSRFMVQQIEAADWQRQSELDKRSVMRGAGVSPRDLFVMDLATGEGGIFNPCGYAQADIRKHQLWTSLLFPSFLEWLYQQVAGKPDFDVDDLPRMVHIESLKVGGGERGSGPMEALLKRVLQGSDKGSKALARQVWRGLYADRPAPGVPPTLDQFKEWIGS